MGQKIPRKCADAREDWGVKWEGREAEKWNVERWRGSMKGWEKGQWEYVTVT